PGFFDFSLQGYSGIGGARPGKLRSGTAMSAPSTPDRTAATPPAERLTIYVSMQPDESPMTAVMAAAFFVGLAAVLGIGARSRVGGWKEPMVVVLAAVCLACAGAALFNVGRLHRRARQHARTLQAPPAE